MSVAEAARFPIKTIPVTAASDAGYLLGLSVFHDLHCLDSLRQAIWADASHEATGSESTSHDHGPEHLMHCVNSLREKLMCHADVAPLSWQWSEAEDGLRVYSDVPHQCRDFSAVLEWGKEHAYDGSVDTSWWPEGRPPEIGLCGVGECAS